MAESLKDARVAFTGKLASMTRPEAVQIVLAAGGKAADGVSHSTSMLVVGMCGWPLLPDGQISNKLRRAEDLGRKGCRLRIVSELVFLELAGLTARQCELWKAYPGHEVCQILNIQPGTLQRWEQFSLVHSHNGLYDFQDVVSLQTMCDLVSRGVKPETVAQSLKRLASVLPLTERPLAQLRIVVEHPRSILADFGQYRLSPGGELYFNFECEPKSEAPVISFPSDDLESYEWFERGQVCEDEARLEEAATAYRKAISKSPQFPEAYFNLGNVLLELGRLDAAEEVYRTAAAQNPGFASAWYNLAHVQEASAKVAEAIVSLERALSVSPEYADAHFNLALCLEKVGRQQDADRHWSAYQELESKK
ncbi:MAG: tetratricopeptide repeat protein [Verrucomicrobia bacterium]|nr:tetratricopeptide repeat protein [Verrucomicrobiota bacterium]